MRHNSRSSLSTRMPNAAMSMSWCLFSALTRSLHLRHGQPALRIQPAAATPSVSSALPPLQSTQLTTFTMYVYMPMVPRHRATGGYWNVGRTHESTWLLQGSATVETSRPAGLVGCPTPCPPR
jgi:hypothetical protein